MDLQQDASVNLTGYSTASYSKGGQYNGGGYYPQGSTPMYDKYGNAIDKYGNPILEDAKGLTTG